MSNLQHKKILLGITGSIAAYKAAELARLLRKEQADVNVVMSQCSQRFISALTLEAIIGKKVYTDLFEFQTSAMEHIQLARWADLILIAPASANCIARLANGLADDLLTTLCLASKAPIYVAPAMNQQMWSNSITQTNVKFLQSHHLQFLGPDSGEQACGDEGFGRLVEPAEIIAQLSTEKNQSLQGFKILITAGPTQEAIDPVRFISNHSSGKMGYALAQAFSDAGATVHLISGPSKLPMPQVQSYQEVKSALEMRAAVMQHATDCNLFISAAAVADFRVENPMHRKLKKSDKMQLTLIKNPDILAEVAAMPHAPFTVGFAAETENLLDNARLKLHKKNVDMIIANQIQDIGPFYADENEVWVLWKNQEPVFLASTAKLQLAKQIRDLVMKSFEPATKAAGSVVKDILI